MMIKLHSIVPDQPINASISPLIYSLLLIGEPYTVTCNVSKLPGLTRTPTAQWIQVTTGTGRLISPTPSQATLKFSLLRTSDAGTYRCQGNLNTTVYPDLLSDSSDFDLNVQSK